MTLSNNAEWISDTGNIMDESKIIMPNKRSQIKGVHLYESLEEQTNVSFRKQKRSAKKMN